VREEELSEGYTKLFSSILDSTVWLEDGPTRLVWIAMLAMVNRDGCVEAPIPGLAARARVTLAECEAALAKFMAPDPYSRSTEFEGRRIERVDGGWRLLNARKYREKMSKEDRRERDAARKREERGRLRTQVDASENVRDVSHAEAEADRDPDSESEISETKSSCVLPVAPARTPEARAPESVNHPDPDVEALAQCIAADPQFTSLNAVRIATLAMPPTKRKPLAWLTLAVREASDKLPDGSTHDAKHRWLVGCLKNAKPPRDEPATAVRYRDFKPDNVKPIAAGKQAELAARVAGIGTGGVK